MNNELKMKLHEIIENATQALKRHDMDDEHWKVLLSLLRYNAREFNHLFTKFEGEEE
tara:strand:- start:33 stop:203 length:171 start_codon:yes stop_codon:yes gene_type:complete